MSTSIQITAIGKIYRGGPMIPYGVYRTTVVVEPLRYQMQKLLRSSAGHDATAVAIATANGGVDGFQFLVVLKIA
jgi:hypothetical protein